MLSAFVRQRLGELNLATGSGAAGGARPPQLERIRDGATGLPGREMQSDAGPHWAVEQELGAVWRDADKWLDLGSSGPEIPPPEIAAMRQHSPHGLLYLDVETCGFAGAAVFLIGLVHWGPAGWVLTQLLARHYGEEPAILSTLWRLASSKAVLVTFNGKSFDWPMLNDRSILHGGARPAAERFRHFDVLHHARRRWRHELPDCRLQTLEQRVCGRRRAGDLGGALVPQAYHEYVRTGDTARLAGILEHNLLDLVTLLQLATRLSKTDQGPGNTCCHECG